MKKNISTISSRLREMLMMLALLVFVATAPSCDNTIYDYGDCEPELQPDDPEKPTPDKPKPDDPTPDDPTPEEPTVYYVRFHFDMNLQYVDAFRSNVTSVDLYVFRNGSFVARYHEDNTAKLNAEDYAMELTDLEAGTYEMIAWCGVNEGYNFTVPTSVSNRTQTDCTMIYSNAVQDARMAAMFYGQPENGSKVTYTEDPGAQYGDVYLIKDTNNINVVIQHLDGLKFEKDRFTATITDNNGYMLYDNSVPDRNEMITYKPYRIVYDEMEYASGTGNYLQVEFSTARLLESHAATLQIRDKQADDKVIYEFPVINWALRLRSSEHKGMPDQEYLDRQDHYNLLVLLKDDKDGPGWIGAEVRILDWHVVDDSSNL